MCTRQANIGINVAGSLFILSFVTLSGCEDRTPRHMELLFKPNTELSEIVGFPDLLAMLKRRSSLGYTPLTQLAMAIGSPPSRRKNSGQKLLWRSLACDAK